MENRFSTVVQAFSLIFLLSFLPGVSQADSNAQATITGFSGSKIKLYKDSKTKEVWKRLSAKQLRALGGDHKIIAATNSRYAFEYENQTVWIKRKNARTNNVKTGLPPCPKVASFAQEAAGNAVSRGSGASCQ